MWNKSAMLLMVRIKVPKHRGFYFPVPIWVINEFLEALRNLAWVGEIALRHIPVSQEKKSGKHLRWIKTISLSNIIAASHNIIKDLTKYRGLDLVDVKAGDVQVKVSLK